MADSHTGSGSCLGDSSRKRRVTKALRVSAYYALTPSASLLTTYCFLVYAAGAPSETLLSPATVVTAYLISLVIVYATEDRSNA